MEYTGFSPTSSAEIEQEEHRVKRVYIVDGYIIDILFCEGATKRYDASKLFDVHPMFAALKDYNLFKKIHIVGDFAVGWSDSVDIGAEFLWCEGELISTAFDELISMADAVDLWGLSDSALRKAIARGKLQEGIDAKKFGKQWVLVKGSVEREYGIVKK